MTRIVAGTHGGRRLAVPEGTDTRPTSDRVREALFSALESRLELRGSRFADLYAGSGAIGLEAHSRGAEHVLLVESAARAVKVIRENMVALKTDRTVELMAATVAAVVSGTPAAPYDLVFADPPYAVTDADVDAVLAGLADHGWLAEGAVVVVERGRRAKEPTWPAGLVGDRSKRYGDAMLWYAEYLPAEPAS